MACRAIQTGTVDAVLVVGTDCEVDAAVMAALNASSSLSVRYNDDPARASRPFDTDRDGNVIGEGAGAVLLEAESRAEAREARVYARIAGYQVCSAGRNRQYSHDNPELDIRPCTRALRGALDEAGWAPDEVDVINANGSSSVLYDRLEAAAIRDVFSSCLEGIRVHSIKSMLGQHGAGSSALQVITSALGIRRCAVPPTINHERIDPECAGLNIVTETQDFAPDKVLVHAIGLGGFYYSWMALENVDDGRSSGMGQVVWSRGGHPRFRPQETFREPLEPWSPRTG
jgi:3-oxoacyl-(acyl-carrier-protein) synthase